MNLDLKITLCFPFAERASHLLKDTLNQMSVKIETHCGSFKESSSLDKALYKTFVYIASQRLTERSKLEHKTTTKSQLYSKAFS